jgi:hypothetical protein
MRRMLWLLILLALAAPASAFPALPAEFSGSVTIDGSLAPAGTVITARIGDRECGSLTLTTAGVYGGDALFDERLIVSGEEGDAGKTVTFLVDGVKASKTTVYTPGTSSSLALAVTKGSGSGGSSDGSSGSSGGGGGGSFGSFMPAAPVMEYTGSGSLQTDAEGAVQFATIVTTTEGDAALSIAPGVRAEDRFGRPLSTVSVRSVPPADLPAPGEEEAPVGRALRCGPDGATFDPPIEVSFTLTPEEWERYAAGQFSVRLYNSATGAWEPLATTANPATRTVTAAVPHFTLIAVFAVPAEETVAATPAPLTEPTLTFGPVASATAVQQAGLPFSWLTGVAALAGAGLLVRRRG